jgi:hypothetical protein
MSRRCAVFKVTRLVHLDSQDDASVASVSARIRDEVGEVPANRIVVAPTLPGARNGGDVLVHLEFPDAGGWERIRDAVDGSIRENGARHVDGVEYSGGGADMSWTGSRVTGAKPTVYRSLLLKVDDETEPAVVDKFERELLTMPRYVNSMLSWQLSRVTSATGASRWTHVWEQSFVDLDGLLGAYMHHPVHWGYVDRWFDPECPEQIVKERVCHSFCSLTY